MRISAKAKKLRPGIRRKIRVTVTNDGSGQALRLKVCTKVPRERVKIRKCVTLGNLAAGKAKVATFTARLKKKSKRASKVKITFTAYSENATKRTGTAVLRLKRR